MTEPPSHDEIRRRWAETYGESAPPPRRRGGGRRVVLLIIVLIVLGGGYLVLRDHFGPAPDIDTGSAPQPEQIAQFDPAKPYSNTPAASWADGADGIVEPTPVAVGQFTAVQVGEAQAAAKQLLITGHLDNRMLVDHDPSAFLALLAPTMQSRVRAEIAGTDRDYGGALTLLAPGYHLLPVPIKVDGSMTPQVNQDGNLVIHVNYVFAFPFAPVDPNSIQYAWETVAVQHTQFDVETIAGNRYVAADQGLWLMNTSGYTANESCSAADQGYLGPAYSDQAAPGAASATEDPNALFAPEHPMNIPDTCDN